MDRKENPITGMDLEKWRRICSGWRDKKDTIIKFVNDKYQSLKESFAPNVGKMDLCYLYAYGIAEKEEKEKMEELLLNFMKEDDFHIQERMEEEPIKVERQMDKFKMRG